ncbi:MAG TPA: glycoside hydrolase family 5 protein, partial [Polyangiaceae bacterium]
GGAPNTDDGGTGGTPAAGGGGSSSLGGSAGSAGSGAGVLESGAPIDADSVPALNPVATYGQLKVVGTELEDQNGQAVQLKGVSSQWLNYETMMFPESKPAIQYARDHWKLSVIRAAMGIDAAGGYLGTGTGANAAMATMQTKVETIVQNAIDLGIYVIVDWHTSNAVTATTTQTTQATAFFSALAQKFGSVPNIIYEPYNEPNRVTWAQIKPYHESVVAAIRAVDPDNLIVLGTPTFSQDVDLAALDPVAGTNLLYTLHFYACTHQQALRDKATLALSRGIALFVTEFGATPADGGLARDPFVCEDATNAWFSWMGDHHISGVSWKLDRCTATSCDTSNILTADAPVDGPWTDNFLTNDSNATPVDGGVRPASGGGHGQFVVNWLRQ